MSEFNPTEHNVDEVEEYVRTVSDPDEVARVRAAEAEGKNRSSIDWPEQVIEPVIEPVTEPTVIEVQDDEKTAPEPDTEPEDATDVKGTDDEPEDESEPAESGKPKWITQTHGRVPESRKHLYDVVGE